MKKKKIYIILTILLSFAFILGGCGTPTNTTADAPTDAPAEDPIRVLLMTEDPIGINPYFLSGIEGMEAAELDFNIETTIVEGTSDPALNDENVRSVVREDYDLIILMTFGFTDVLLEVAPDYPDLPIVCIDCAVEVDSVLNVDFNSHEAAFLTGVAAGLLTESNILGQIGPLDIPFMHRWIDPFTEGALYANPDIIMLEPLYTGDWADPATAKELAILLSDQGADVINGAAAGGNSGIYEAAEQLDFLTFGADINECPSAPGYIIDNTLKRVDRTVYDSIAAFIAGELTGGWAAYGLADGGVDLAVYTWPEEDTQCVLADHPEVMSEVGEIRQMIIDGEIVIPDPLFGGEYVLP
jgi:basic membrane protein A and related proteins